MVKNPPANEGDPRDVGLKPGLGRALEVGNGSPLQYYCLENSKDRGDWQLQSRRLQSIRHDQVTEQKYFGYYLFIRHVFCRYFLLVCGLSFHSLHSVFHRAGKKI